MINAGQNADQAASTLNNGCADMEKCEWQSDKALTTEYGPTRIIGDVLYNCSEDGEAESAIAVSDERGEATSVSESVSLEISLGFLDLEKSSLEFDAFSKQAQSFSTEVTATNAVSVPPGYKGWTDAKLLSADVNGSAYITQGIHLIQVQNIDLQFPGYQGPDAKGQAQVVYSTNATPMSSDEELSRCGAAGATTASASRAMGAARARQASARREKPFKINICRPKPASRGRHRCEKLTVTGMRPPRVDKVTATLTRAGKTYAHEMDRHGPILLTQKRPMTPGRYKLIIREKPRKMIERRNGKRLHTAELHKLTIVPVTIRWARGM